MAAGGREPSWPHQVTSSSPGTGLDPAEGGTNPAVLSSSASPGAERRASWEKHPQTTVAAFYVAKYMARAAAEINSGPQSMCSGGTSQPLQRCPGNAYL